jgi:hypothetical protein
VLKNQKPEFLEAWEKFVEESFEDLTAKSILVTINNAEPPDAHHSDKNVLITLELSCYLCPTASSYFVYYDQDTQDPLTLRGLDHSFNDLNSNGHQHLLENVRPTSERWAGLENQYFRRSGGWRYPQASVNYLVSMASSHLNFSLKNIPKPNNTRPGLILCHHCGYLPDPYSPNIKSFLMFINSISFIYCQTGISLQNISLASVLFVSYDIYTWISLLLSLILLACVPKITLWRTMDLMWSILGQPPQDRKHGLLTFMCLSVILFQQMYLSYFTSNVVKPFDKVYIDSNKELLLESSYRILVTENRSLSSYSTVFHNTYEYELSKIGLSINDSNFEDHFLRLKETADKRIGGLKKVSMTRDKGTELFFTKFGRQYVVVAEAYEPGVNCHMVKETWSSYRVWMYFQGHITQALNEFLKRIIMSGIDVYWDKAFFNYVDRDTRKAAARKVYRQGHNSGIEAASMKTSLSSFFQLFVIILGFNILVFLMELIFSPRVVQNSISRLNIRVWYLKNLAIRNIHKG